LATLQKLSRKLMKADFTIGIATKNRWDDLKITLSKIREYGWQDVRVLLYDDFSDEPCPFDVNKILSNVELKRFSESRGYISRRNQLAENISTPYYLSLDDDSYPMQGSVDQVLDLISSNEEIFCVAFPIFNPIANQNQVASLQNTPYQVKSFIGCAHLLDVVKFKSIGEYREELIHQGEELDIAIRAFKRGWKCYHHPGFLVHHNMSLNGRNWDRMDYYGARNNILWNDWYLPKWIKILVQIKNIFSRILLAIRVRRSGQITGIRDGIKKIKELKTLRDELSLNTYLHWRKLPNS
jgi:GT2 family glycosyltransferase